MGLRKAVGVAGLAAGIGLTGLLGLGIGTAGADPGPGCNRPGVPCDHQDNRGPGNNDRGPGNNDRGPANNDWGHRGIDQGRNDHQPFNWNGQRVTPMPAGDGHGWGFWFLNNWIPL